MMGYVPDGLEGVPLFLSELHYAEIKHTIVSSKKACILCLFLFLLFLFFTSTFIII